MGDQDTRTGHRKRLHQRFLDNPQGLSDLQILELLLTYAIPRKDLSQISSSMMEQFGSLQNIVSASQEELEDIKGIGEAAATLLLTVNDILIRIITDNNSSEEEDDMEGQQPGLFPIDEQPRKESKTQVKKPPPPPRTKADIRSYTNDLSEAALIYLPRAVEFEHVIEFAAYLEKNLPYNSGVTRKRYASNLINRFFPDGNLHTSLYKFFDYESDDDSLKMVLFFETARNEPAVQYVAEEVLWPALPVGHISREDLKRKLQHRFAEASEATIKRMTYSIVRLYTVLGIASLKGEKLRLSTRIGTLDSFAYVLASLFPEPGIYSFEKLEQGPMRYWLQWDREWIRRQLYNLRDFDLLSKVSEIDNYRQFTIQNSLEAILGAFFQDLRRTELVLREDNSSEGIKQ